MRPWGQHFRQTSCWISLILAIVNWGCFSLNHVLGVNSSLVGACLVGNLHKIGDTGEMVTGTALKTNSTLANFQVKIDFK